MAIIRLPQTQALADAPKPVLDNQQRPTVNNRAVASAVNELAQAQRAPEAPMSLAVNGYEAVGRAIQQTGSVLGALYKEKQEAITRKQIGDADAGVAALKMGHESWKESTQADPIKWEERRAAAMQSFREKTLADESLTSEARQQIIARLDREDGVWKAEDEMRGAKKIFGDVHDMYAADIKRAAIEQNRARWEELRKAGGKYFQEVQKLAQEEEFKSIGERNALKAKADELDAAENEVVTIASGNGEADALAHVDAMPFDEIKKEALRNVAKRVSASRQGEAQDFILDGIASGDFRTPEAIDAAVHGNPHFQPRVVEMLKSHVVKMQNAEVRAAMNAPEAIARSQAELSAKVREYDRAADKDGLQAAQLKSEIAMRLKDDDAGYLKQSLWAKFNQSDAKGDLPSSKAILNDAIGSVFESSWKGLPLEWVDKDGKRHKTYDDPQKRADAIDAEYRVRLKYNEWERQNPDDAKDPEKIRAKVMQLIPEAKKINVLNSLPPLPQASGGTTAIKLSNYGYASDTTPDSYSARGIGHANNKLEDGVSAAITKSLAVRLGLKTGDWLQLETTKGPMRVRYDDTVPATDKRTGDLPETIDIYRKDGSNTWGGKVIGVRKLDSLARM